MAVRKKVFVMLWESHTKLLESVRDRLDVDIEVFRQYRFDGSGMTMDDVVDLMRSCDASIVYRQNSQFSSDLEQAVMPYRDDMSIISFGVDPTMWSLTTVDHDLAIRTFEYMQESGEENFIRMFDSLEKGLGWKDGDPLPPVRLPWQGVVDPDTGEVFLSTREYMSAKGMDTSRPTVGIIASRPMFMNDGLTIERSLQGPDLPRCQSHTGVRLILQETGFRCDKPW